jgi:hypothetical protein
MMYDNIRIGDADRESVTSRLREHYAEGRLTAEELDERISATLNAKTFGDLRPIMADLPEPAQPGPIGPQPGPMPPPYPGPVYGYRRGPRFLPVALFLLFFVLALSGGAFGLVRFVLLAWLILCVAGIFSAARFRRRNRRHPQSGQGDPWNRNTWQR